MEATYFIEIFLPGFVSQAFDVVNMQSDEFRIDVFLDEKKIIPPDMPNKHLISHGFRIFRLEAKPSICIFAGVSG